MTLCVRVVNSVPCVYIMRFNICVQSIVSAAANIFPTMRVFEASVSDHSANHSVSRHDPSRSITSIIPQELASSASQRSVRTALSQSESRPYSASQSLPLARAVVLRPQTPNADIISRPSTSTRPPTASSRKPLLAEVLTANADIGTSFSPDRLIDSIRPNTAPAISPTVVLPATGTSKLISFIRRETMKQPQLQTAIVDLWRLLVPAVAPSSFSATTEPVSTSFTDEESPSVQPSGRITEPATLLSRSAYLWFNTVLYNVLNPLEVHQDRLWPLQPPTIRHRFVSEYVHVCVFDKRDLF